MRIKIPLLATMFLAATVLCGATGAQTPSWDAVVQKARGQDVYWNAWGGDEKINAYIAWVGEQVQKQYGVTLHHVKLADTADAVGRVIADKAAGKETGGGIDLIWINGENFAKLKSQNLLFGPFVDRLPHAALIDREGKPSTVTDFTVPTEGYESPWGMAQLVFPYDSARVPEPPRDWIMSKSDIPQPIPPRSVLSFLTFAKAHPGRFTYPAPPDFLGTTFLKQVLINLSTEPARLQQPVNEKDFAAVTAPLWDYLDTLHPYLWRKGKEFPASGEALRQMLADGEVDISISFNPGGASSDIAQGLLPASVRSFVLDGGTIGNTHFVAIPFNANAKEGAMVVADFLLSPAAQLRKQDAMIWGDPTVLNMAALQEDDRKAFESQARGPATLSPAELGKTLLEPHPSWVDRLEMEWKKRYAQ